jgi:hypothetical protein
MAFSLVQFAGASTGGSVVTTQTLAYANPVVAGNMLLMTTREPTGAGQTLLVTDTLGNTWLSAMKFSNGAEQYEMFYVKKCVSSGANTVSVSKSGGGTFFFRLSISEWSGFSPSAILDTSASSTTTSLPDIGTPFIKPATSSELLIGFFANQNADNVSATIPSTFSAVNQVDGNLVTSYQALPNTQPSSWFAGMNSVPSTQYDASIVALQAGSSGTAIPAFVQQAVHATGVSTATSASVTATITAGNTVFVTLEWNTTAIAASSVTDNLGNTYTAVANTLQQNASLGTGYSIRNFVGTITTGGSATITGNWPGGGTANTYPGIYIAEFTNIDTTTPVQTSNGRTGNAIPTSQTISPTGNVVLMGTFFTAGANTVPTPPWILLSAGGGAASDAYVMSMYQIVLSGRYNYVGTMSLYNTAGAGIAAFKSLSTATPNLLMMMGCGT